MNADDYNVRKIELGELTPAHIVKLVKNWQACHDLTPDGFAGPKTRASFADSELAKVMPLMRLPDGRGPIITSPFKDDNRGRGDHDGIDFFYKWLDSDPAVFSGHGGAIMRKGKRRWWYPDGAMAVSAAAGVVTKASMASRGFRVWVDHGNGERTGYFHGARLLVRSGDTIAAGVPVIMIGDNPNGGYKKHLHFEVSPSDRYAPMNPRIWLEGAKQL